MRAHLHALLACATLLAPPALANEWLIGDYAGKIVENSGYDVKPEDACQVAVTRNESYGGSLVFEIKGLDKIVIETRNVDAALQVGGPIIKIYSPGLNNRPGEWVFLRLSNDSKLLALKLKFVWSKQHLEKTVSCGYLKKS
jgi:hypothetical protein